MSNFSQRNGTDSSNNDYSVTDIENSNANNGFGYSGFSRETGEWIIKRTNYLPNSDYEFRWATPELNPTRISSNYESVWADRETLIYGIKS